MILRSVRGVAFYACTRTAGVCLTNRSHDYGFTNNQPAEVVANMSAHHLTQAHKAQRVVVAVAVFMRYKTRGVDSRSGLHASTPPNDLQLGDRPQLRPADARGRGTPLRTLRLY